MARINTIQKMHRVNAKARKYLESKGYEIYVVPHTMWQKDAFGLFDVIAINKEIVAFVQIKTNSWGSIPPFNEFKKKYPHLNIMILRYDDRKGFSERWIS